MNNIMKNYQSWLDDDFIDQKTKDELKSIENMPDEIEDRFYQELEFGTAGLRGKIGAGTNRMNIYIVSRASHALAQVIKNHGQEYMDKGIAIAYDCRLFSPEFALQSALVMAANGIKAYLFESLRPTPELSYAIRYYGCSAGINVTASHNPKDYNGYKVYWEEGSQIKSDIADQVLQEILKIKFFANIPFISEADARNKGLLIDIGKEVDDSYIKQVMNVSLRDEEIDKSLKIVYTPLNGAGNIPVRKVLDLKGFKNVYVVKEQELPDGNFPTIEYPNPEDLKAFEYSERLAKELDADILIATDPDCDRLAVQVKHNNKIMPLTGNQTGVILINYILSTMAEKNLLPANPVMVKSIVTGEMGSAIANDYGVEMISVLTGFKNICAIPNEYEITKEKNFIFGFEESIGYVIGTFVRDKDAVSASLMLAEACAYYKKQGKTLIDVLDDLFKKYGFYQEKTISVVLEGIEGQKRIKRMMESYRDIFPTNIGSSKLVQLIDYEKQLSKNLLNDESITIDIEKTDAVKFIFDDGCWYALRPSGTEPKIKLYLYSKADILSDATNKLKEFEILILEKLNNIE